MEAEMGDRNRGQHDSSLLAVLAEKIFKTLTLQLSPNLSRWVNSTTGKKKNRYFGFGHECMN